ncbi:T-cell-specific surface glycoprotein CD28-like isoform X2 [Scyliorhinus canicula]|uniref:T-cell-specific surface glycoprotein CD28-like isoform X2 n=1 Tax=Scyliorhinus canicula TaxID=7830 RepID=UPI0018F7844B|nr:T-cell-specific surface glycoprotein CD28-like isoform X2 [Scyliorhinus canicula]
MKQVNQSETHALLHISSKRFPIWNTSAIHNVSEGSFNVSGNLKQGLIVLEITNMQKTDFGLYICKVTRTIPPPPMEGRGIGTNIVEHRKSSPRSGAGNATCLHQHSISENVLITIIVNLVIYALIMTVLILVCWICKRRSRETQRDSLIYEDMNVGKSDMRQKQAC